METFKAHIDLEMLESWPRKEGVGRGRLENVCMLSGGTQNVLMKFVLDGRHLVLRRPPPVLRQSSNETMRREARLLAALSASDLPHPPLVAVSSDERILGAAFYVMEAVDGFNPTEGLPPIYASNADFRREMGLVMARTAARLGELDYEALGLDGFGNPVGYLERQAGRWRAHLDTYRRFKAWPGVEALGSVAEVGEWLEAHRPVAGRPGILHGDFHIANVLFDRASPTLKALLDWELSTIGDPLLDLGWLLATWSETETIEPEDVGVEPWTGFPTHRELVAEYSKCSSRDLTNVGWYAVLACWKMAIVVEGTYARALDGQAPPDTGIRLHKKAQGLIARAERWVARPIV